MNLNKLNKKQTPDEEREEGMDIEKNLRILDSVVSIVTNVALLVLAILS